MCRYGRCSGDTPEYLVCESCVIISYLQSINTYHGLAATSLAAPAGQELSLYVDIARSSRLRFRDFFVLLEGNKSCYPLSPLDNI